MWKTVIILGCSIGAVLATPIGIKNMPIMVEEEMQNQKSEMAMTTLNLPSNATSIRADITDGFTCTNKTYGYYADVENECQIFHVCLPVVYADGRENTFRWSFICPEETLFSQESFTCVRGEDMNFGCDESERFYDLNRNFGMTPDSSMEMSSMEADMDEYYMKTDLGSSALTKISEEITEQDSTPIKPVEKKTENQQRVTPVKPHKVPLRNSVVKAKPEPSKKPTSNSSTTKRVYTKNYNKVRRPLIPQSPSTKAPQQIHIELPPQTTKYEHTTTVRIDTKDPIITSQKQDPQKIVHDVEELMVTKIMETLQQHQNDQVQILNDEAPVVFEATVQNLELPKLEKLSDKQTEDKNKLTDDIKENDRDVAKHDQNEPALIQNLEEQTKPEPWVEEDIKEEQVPDITKAESATVIELVKEQTDKEQTIEAEMTAEHVLDNTKTSEHEVISKPNVVPERTIEEDMLTLEANSKTHVNGQPHVESQNGNQIQTEAVDSNSQTEKVEIKVKLPELEVERKPVELTSAAIGEKPEEGNMSSQEQEDMIIKTIADLMNAANLLSTEKLPIAEETSISPNPSSLSDTPESNEDAKDRDALETSPELITEQNVTQDSSVQLNVESLMIPTSVDNQEENFEIVHEALLNKVNNNNNAESNQYNVQGPGSINSLGVEENKNELENDNMNKGAESFLGSDASSDKEAPMVQIEKGVGELEDNLNVSEQNREVVESLPTQEVLDETPLADQMPEINELKLEETPAAANPKPVHDLIMSQPSQSYVTLSSEMNGQFSSEQVIPVFIIQDEPTNSDSTGNTENKAENISTVEEENLDSSPIEDEEVKPIYQRIKEFHSNLLKADLLSADLDDEPAVHEISGNKEADQSTLDQKEEKQMDVSIESLPSESALDFLAQTDASKDFLKVMPLETENMQTPPEPVTLGSSGQEKEEKLEGEVPTEAENDTLLERSKTSRKLQKNMDPRKRRFLFRADAS